MSLKKRVFKNSSANLISFAWNSALFFFVTPYMIHKLGVDNFGIIALTYIFTGFLGFLDFGFTGAAVKQISESYAKKEYGHISEIVSISLLIYIIMGFIGGVALFAFATSPFISIFSVNAKLISNLRFSLYIASINIIINFILGVFSNIPYAIQMNVIQAKCNIILETLSNIIVVVFLFFGFGLKTVMVLKLLTSFIGLVTYYLIDRKLIVSLVIRPYWDKAVFKSMFSFSAYSMVSQFSGILTAQFDRILLGSLLSISSITYYTVPINIASKTCSVVEKVTNVFFPLTSEFLATNNLDKIKVLYFKAIKLICYLNFIMILPLFIFSKNILSMYLGADFASHINIIFRIALVAYVFFAVQTLCYFIYNGLNKPQINAVQAVVNCILKVVFCIILIPFFKEKGAAVAFLLSMMSVPVYIWYFERLFNIKKLYFIVKVYFPSLCIAGIVVLLFSFIDYKGENLFIVAALCLASVIMYTLGCFLVRFFDKDTIREIKDFLFQLKNSHDQSNEN